MTRQEKISPIKQIREYCKSCVGVGCGGGIGDIRTCKAKDCNLYPYRFGTRPKGSLPTLKSIHGQCVQCIGSAQKVRECSSSSCSLWELRNGNNPTNTRTISSEHIAAMQAGRKRNRIKE